MINFEAALLAALILMLDLPLNQLSNPNPHISMEKELIYLFNQLIICAEVFFGIFLITKSKFKSMPLLFLGLFMLTLSLTFISLVLYYEHLYYKYPHTIQIENFLVLAHAPLFYLFIGSLLEGDSFISPKSFLHFIPALLVVFLTLPFYVSPLSDKLEYLDAVYSSRHPVRYLVISFAAFTQYIIYYVVSFKMLISFSYKLSKIKNASSETRLWVNALIAVFYVSTAMSFFPGFLNFNELSAAYIPIVSSPYFFFVLYSIIKRPYVFKIVSLDTEVIDSVDFLDKHKKVEDLAERYGELADRLHREIVSRKLFKDPELSLSKLSSLLETKNHVITWVLKNHYNENFYTYINSLRVEEAKLMLADVNYSDYTIDYIGQLVGFNSKSVFYTAFKRYTGETPMQYLKRNNKRQLITTIE